MSRKTRLGRYVPGTTRTSRYEKGRGYLLGGGDPQFTFPTVSQLVANAVRRLYTDFELPELEVEGGDELVDLHPLRTQLQNGSRSKVRVSSPGQTGGQRDWFVRLAEGRRQVFATDLFVNAVDMRFEPETLVLSRWPDLGPEWQNVCESLLAELEQIRSRVTEALPEIMEELIKRYPQARLGELYQAALHLTDEQLQPVLETLYLWVSGIQQWLDPRYHDDVVLLRAAIEERIVLLLTGKLGAKSDKLARQVVDTINVKVGDLIVPVLTDSLGSGPAVVPMTGELGPQGAHLMMYPANMLRLIASSSPIYSHEMGHLFEAIVVALEETLTAIIGDAIAKGVESGAIKTSLSRVEIAPNVFVPVGEFLAKVFIDEHGELFADLIGCLVSGPKAFGLDFSTYIVGLISLMNGEGVSRMRRRQKIKEHGAYFRSGSTYKVELTERGDEEVITFESHPIDIVRVGVWLPAIARLMGYPEVAAELEGLAAKYGGTKPATKIFWEFEGDDEPQESDDSGQPEQSQAAGQPGTGDGGVAADEFVIEMPVADWAAAAQVVLEAIASTPLKELGGRTLMQLVMLSRELYDTEVEPLIVWLLSEQPVPDDGRFIPFHLIGAAATAAVRRRLEREPQADGFEVETVVNTRARLLMKAMLGQWEALKAESDPYNMDGEH